jgi:hypothetical protein
MTLAFLAKLLNPKTWGFLVMIILPLTGRRPSRPTHTNVVCFEAFSRSLSWQTRIDSSC